MRTVIVDQHCLASLNTHTTRLLLLVSAMMLLLPGSALSGGVVPDALLDGLGLALLVGVALFSLRRGSTATART